MAPVSAMHIYFIRKVKIEERKKDDTLIIFPSSKKEGAFEVRYRIPAAEATVNSTSDWLTQMFVTAQDLEEYILSHLELQNYDEEPFEYVQFSWPSGPTVLLKHDKLLTCLSVLMRIMRVHLKSWPTRVEERKERNPEPEPVVETMRVTPPPSRVGAPQHLFFDEYSSFRRN